MVALATTRTTAGCDDEPGQRADPGCPDATTGSRVPLSMIEGPPRDLSQLVMCTNARGTAVFVGNDTKVVWLVRTTPNVMADRHGGVPTDVQLFRMWRAKKPLYGTPLEPGTSLTVPLPPAQVTLQIDVVLQHQWATFDMLGKTFSAAGENLPELVKNDKYKNAVRSCLEASTRIAGHAAAARYDTEKWIDSLGLLSGGATCAADLKLAEDERQLKAWREGRRPLPTLKPSTFAQNARSVSSEFDDVLKAVGRILAKS
ncbi:hypothetical protein [Amycolatopsis keratiniphila]|uniref:Uncharacterized protein n=1 Tax=Amycolatopsis keratiniphila subsp. keratiniphila TaxID=227715 RepID=A0A1W2LVX6_9PSEU|nr:hypothetical protein [Amycolatopsis keratiniphila]ONF70703.1 hypothetical protein AVR91_0213820 [Amycolatopsis keratiniphila subsp. keratiniphila]